MHVPLNVTLSMFQSLFFWMVVGNTGYRPNQYYHHGVSILILLDGGRQPNTAEWQNLNGLSFNPYSSGWWSATSVGSFRPFRRRFSFNPYSSGWWSATKFSKSATAYWHPFQSLFFWMVVGN